MILDLQSWTPNYGYKIQTTTYTNSSTTVQLPSSYIKRKFGSPSISIGSLVLWCEENGQLPPNDEKHKTFVIEYNCDTNYFKLFA